MTFSTSRFYLPVFIKCIPSSYSRYVSYLCSLWCKHRNRTNSMHLSNRNAKPFSNSGALISWLFSQCNFAWGNMTHNLFQLPFYVEKLEKLIKKVEDNWEIRGFDMNFQFYFNFSFSVLSNKLKHAIVVWVCQFGISTILK